MIMTNLELKLLVSSDRGRRNLSKCSDCGEALIEFVDPTLIQNELLSRTLQELWQASGDTSKVSTQGRAKGPEPCSNVYHTETAISEMTRCC